MKNFHTGNKRRQGRAGKDRSSMSLSPSYVLNAENRWLTVTLKSHGTRCNFHMYQGQVVIDLNGGASSSAVRLVTLCKPCFSSVHRLKW